MARSFLACGLLASIACGPSLKQAQRSVERYEACYGADYDPKVTPGERRSCWSTWLSDCAKNQPPERIRHAQMRIDQLAIDGSTLPLPNAAPRPPAKREQRYPRRPPTGYPTSPCDPLCDTRWATCNGYCEVKDTSCAVACEGEYRVCVVGCP
ncbi:MAG: hypothetical protein PVH76_13390 [Myxococcales bacterium]